MAIHLRKNDCLYIEDIPRDAIEDMAHPGDCEPDVRRWRAELGFTVDRAGAIDCLEAYGAWERPELEAMDDEDLAIRCLWIAANDFQEHLTMIERGDFRRDPTTGQIETNAGSDVWVMEP